MHAQRDGVAPKGADADLGNRSAVASRKGASEIERARASVYLLLGTLLSKAPSAELLSNIADLRGDASPLGMAQLALADAARASTVDEAGREHFNIFIGVGRGEVLPYASFYRTGFLNERPLAEVRADLARLGIERRDGVFEPEDHIGTLFEVMAGLLQGELGADDVDAVRETDAFFNTHIGPWAQRLMDDIAATPSAKFYRAVGAFGGTWLAIEREAMRLPG